MILPRSKLGWFNWLVMRWTGFRLVEVLEEPGGRHLRWELLWFGSWRWDAPWPKHRSRWPEERP